MAHMGPRAMYNKVIQKSNLHAFMCIHMSVCMYAWMYVSTCLHA